MPAERILFVTGRLAEASLRELLTTLAPKSGFEFEVAELGISVAALMSVDFVARKLVRPQSVDRVVLPGWCGGDLESLTLKFGTRFERGPKDMFDLPEYFGGQAKSPPDLSQYDIEILAEINHAPRLSDQELLAQAEKYRRDGADVIDLGCIPDERWSRVGAVTRLLRSAGFRVSIDSFDRHEVESAVAAGSELVLSCNSSNADWLSASDAELVVIPYRSSELLMASGEKGKSKNNAVLLPSNSPLATHNTPLFAPDQSQDMDSLQRTIDQLTSAGRRFRVDPVLEPIGFGFAASLARYFDARRRWPNASMMMGIGNLTELSEVDSAGLNFLFAAICQELGIRSVLATEVAHWCRSAVKEFDLARRVMRHAVTNRVLPKHVNSRLVMLRDMKVHEMGEAGLRRLAEEIRDANFRIFVERGELHLLNRDGHWRGTDPFELFDEITRTVPIDSAHSFYLGYELAKAMTALTLGKQYRQDEALQWGFLTIPEISAHERRRNSPK